MMLLLYLDVDECDQDIAVCGVGKCVNTIGDYNCICPDGFMLMQDKNCMGKTIATTCTCTCTYTHMYIHVHVPVHHWLNHCELNDSLGVATMATTSVRGQLSSDARVCLQTCGRATATSPSTRRLTAARWSARPPRHSSSPRSSAAVRLASAGATARSRVSRARDPTRPSTSRSVSDLAK